MYRLTVRDHIMIAHSLNSETFGPAKNLHGATYIVDTEYATKALDKDNLVIDICLAQKALKEILSDLNYKNLDEHSELKSKITTTEYMCKFIHEKLSTSVKSFFNGELKVTLHENHIAWASFEDKV